MNALPSRMIAPGSKAEFDMMKAGAALMDAEAKRVANVCAYWRANVSKKPALRAVKEGRHARA